MMITKAGGMTPLQRPRMQLETVEGRQRTSGQYDSVELQSNHYSQDQRFSMELASRLSQEVRTQRADDMAQVRQQVQAGSYQVNVDSLTRQILLLGGVC